MPNIEIYTWTTCAYCMRAKALLDSKGVSYTEYNITGDDKAREKMIERTGGPRTVPQIFVNDKHYGGCDDIHAMDANAEFDRVFKG